MSILKLTGAELGEYYTIRTEMLDSKGELKKAVFPAIFIGIGELGGSILYQFASRTGLRYSTTDLSEVSAEGPCEEHWYQTKIIHKVECSLCGGEPPNI